MSEPARHLRSVDAATGEVVADCSDCMNLERALRAERAKVTRLRNELSAAMGVEPEAETIIEVLQFWRPLCMPGASIVAGSERWVATRARLRERDAVTKKPAHSPLKLKAAVAGALLSDWHVKHRKLDAATIFRDSKTVEEHAGRCVAFKQRNGVSALALLDELGGTALDWLALRCSCGAFMFEHLHDLYPSRTRSNIVSLPCPRTGCIHFDFFNADVELTLAGMDERARQRFLAERAA